MRWAVVVPSNRPDKLTDFIAAWWQIFETHEVHLVIIHDSDTIPEIVISPTPHFAVTHLCREDVPEYIPVQSDMIRSCGFAYVYNNKLADYVLTLDDDVEPGKTDPFAMYELGYGGAVFSKYMSVGHLTTAGVEMRGFPFKDRSKQEVAVQYGGWSNVLDYDAITQLAVPQETQSFKDFVMPVPNGTPVTCCIMNTAFKVEYTPIMWQLTLLDGRYNRYGDIWSGLFIKKTLDAMGKVMLINGQASIIHNRASDPYKNLQREAPGVWLNDYLWDALPSPKTDSMIEAYREVTDAAATFFAEHDAEYADKFKKDRDAWLKLLN